VKATSMYATALVSQYAANIVLKLGKERNSKYYFYDTRICT